MNRVLQYDQIDFIPTKITQRDDPHLGPITVFHDIVIAREIVQVYDDGRAYKPAQELEDAVWTAEGRWVIMGRHPETGIMSNRGDIGGRTVNVRSTKSLNDPKTGRPNNRGMLVDLEVFDNLVDPMVVSAMKTGIRSDVSIGFFFDQDATPGVIDDAKHPLNGTAYDYVQRNIMIDHTAAALETGTGRCPMPSCGIGADAFKSLVTGDPVGSYKTFGQCVAAIMKKNPSYTKEQAEGTCGKMEEQSKDANSGPRTEAERAMAHFNISEEEWGKLSDEKKQEYISKLPERGSGTKDFKPTEGDNINMSNALEDIRTELQLILDKIPLMKEAVDDLVEEEYQGNAENITESMRARSFFTISDKEWDALTDEEKNDYISRLPPKKGRAGGEELSDRDSDEECEDCDEEDEEHEPCSEGETWSEEEGKCVSSDEESDEEQEEIDAEQETDEVIEEEKIELPSTDQVVKDTEKVLADIERLIG